MPPKPLSLIPERLSSVPGQDIDSPASNTRSKKTTGTPAKSSSEASNPIHPPDRVSSTVENDDLKKPSQTTPLQDEKNGNRGQTPAPPYQEVPPDRMEGVIGETNSRKRRAVDEGDSKGTKISNSVLSSSDKTQYSQATPKIVATHAPVQGKGSVPPKESGFVPSESFPGTWEPKEPSTGPAEKYYKIGSNQYGLMRIEYALEGLPFYEIQPLFGTPGDTPEINIYKRDSEIAGTAINKLRFGTSGTIQLCGIACKPVVDLNRTNMPATLVMFNLKTELERKKTDRGYKATTYYTFKSSLNITVQRLVNDEVHKLRENSGMPLMQIAPRMTAYDHEAAMSRQHYQGALKTEIGGNPAKIAPATAPYQMSPGHTPAIKVEGVGEIGIEQLKQLMTVMIKNAMADSINKSSVDNAG